MQWRISSNKSLITTFFQEFLSLVIVIFYNIFHYILKCHAYFKCFVKKWDSDSHFQPYKNLSSPKQWYSPNNFPYSSH